MTLIVAIIGMITALLTLFGVYKQRGKIEQVHLLVNSRLSEALDEIVALRTTLEDHNINPDP